MLVVAEPAMRSVHECYKGSITLDEVYWHLAGRSDPEQDEYIVHRKRVVQLAWVRACKEADRQLDQDNMGGYEIR